MTARSRTAYSIINMMASIGGYALNILLSFICRIFFVRQLGSEYLGINGLFSNILSMLSLAELGIGTAMIYALYKPIAEDNHSKIAAYMRIYGVAYKVIGCVIAVFGVALIPFLNILIKNPPNISENITVLYLIFLFSTVSSYFYSYKSAILIAHQKNYIVLTISYIVVIIQNIVQIIALLMFKNFMIYLILQVIFVLLSNSIISIKAEKDYPYIKRKNVEKLSKDEIWTLVKNVKALTVTKLSGILVNNTDNIVITYFRGLITTGVVSNYLLLTNTINSLANQIFNSMAASLGNLNAVADEEYTYKIFKVLNLVNFWIYGWAAIGIIVLANDLIEFFFGKNYIVGMEIVIILAVNFYMLGMQSVIGMYKSTMGLFRYGQYILLITAGINLVGDIILGQRYGVIGIFLATAIARALTNTWYEPLVVFKYGFHKKFRYYLVRYSGYLTLLMITGGVCYGVCSVLQLSLIPRLLVKTLICVIIPNFFFGLVFYRFAEFKYLLRVVRNIKDQVIQKIVGKNGSL